MGLVLATMYRMQMLYTVTDPATDEKFFLCSDHRQNAYWDADAVADQGLVISETTAELNEDCVECLEAEGTDDEYDDGDYPGVERDENMSRIEGDDFWMDSGYGEDY